MADEEIADFAQRLALTERALGRVRSELEDERRKVYTLEHSESAEAVRLQCKVKELEGELADAKMDLETVNSALDKTLEVVKQPRPFIGPLTAEEWMEFRLRTEEDEEHELLRCCANTSAIRDELFNLMRSYAEDPLLGRASFVRAWGAFNDHGYEDWSDRARELMDRLHAYYGCGECRDHP